MKKLISKNPVELFKTGIRFAKGGTSLNMSRLYRRSDGTYTTVDGTVVGYWKGKRLGISGLAWKYLASKYGKKYANNANANMVNGNIYQGGKWRADYEKSGNRTVDWETATKGKNIQTFKDKRNKNRTVEFNISRNKPLLKASTQKGSSAAQRLITANNSSLLINGQFLRIAASRNAKIQQNNNGNYYFDMLYGSSKPKQLRIFANGDIYNLATGQLETTNKELRSEYIDRTMPQIATTGWGAKRYRDSQGNIVDSNGDIVSSYEEQKTRPYTIYGRKPGGFGHITIDPEIGLNYYSNPQDNTETYLNNPGLFTLYKKGGKIKVKMADGSGTITIDTPDKDQLAGRKPVGKTKDGENLYLNGDGKVIKHNPKEGSEQTNWMKKGGITKHQRGAKFMGTGVQKGWTSSYGNNLWNGITADLKLTLIGTGKFTEDSFKDARSLQTALNKYFEGNAATMNNRDFTASRIAVDNKWGDLSLKALMHALSMANYDEARPLNVSNVNPVNGPLNGMSTIPTKIEARPEHMYNRAEVRQLLRNQGINPYSLSGAQRQAIRFALNGGHEYNKALLQGIDLKRLTQPVTLRKSGGRLISKDPVKLFKLGGSIAKYGLGDRMASYVKKKKSELNRAKAAANSWSGYELTYPVFTQNGIATKGVVSGRNYVPEATVTASKEGARKSRLTEASKRNASLAKMQDTLFRIGAYDRNKTLYRQAVDGMMGGLTRNAIKRAREMGYEVNEKTGEVKKLNRKGLAQKATDLVHNINEKMKSVKGPVQYTDVLPGDSIEFANWLMDKSKEKQVSNVYDVGKHLVQNVTGLPLAIGGLNEGTQMLAIALDYKDKSNKSKKGNYTVHVLGYNPGTTRYKWSLFDVKDTNTDESIFDKAGNHPGTYILGRYTTITNPNHDVLLRDTYNFNDDTLDFYKKKVDDKTANTYEKIRYYAPLYGANNNIEIFLNIPHERIMNWYNQFKNQ